MILLHSKTSLLMTTRTIPVMICRSYLSFLATCARSLASSCSIASSERPSVVSTDSCTLDRAPIPEPSGSSVALVTRFGGIAHAWRYRLEGRIRMTSDRFEHPRPLRVELAQLSEVLRGSCVAQAVEVRRKGDDGSYRG
jgi:hypothetical protein